MAGGESRELRILLDIDGVLHVGEEPIDGAVGALERLREESAGVRLITNTTSKSRGEIVARLRGMGFDVGEGDVSTPAAAAVAHCRDRGHERALMLVPDGLRRDLEGLGEAGAGQRPDAVVLGDLGAGFTAAVLNEAFRALLEGAELVALQHNRYWRSGEGMVMDVGAWAAALEYAAEVEATVVGKPSAQFFEAALAPIGGSGPAVMVGDDIEGDIGGALDAGLAAVLVRTGKYRADAVAASGIEPTATVDSIAELPALLASGELAGI
jgi:HAD superfamily hydrolase (TIGR01458 family)